MSSRVKRLYLTRLKGVAGTLIAGTQPGPAFKVLAARTTVYAGRNCR